MVELINQSKSKYIVLIPTGIMIIVASWCIGELALFIRESRQTISKTSPELINAISSTKSLINKADNFISQERIAYIDDAIRSQIKATDEATKSANKVALATAKTLENHVQPAIDELKQESKETLATLRSEINSLDSLTQETKHQLKQNGDQVNAVLEEGRSIIVKSEPELLATLAELRKSAESLEVITNDPALVETLRNIKDTSYNVSLISKELSDLAEYTIEPIVKPKPPKNSFNKFFVRPTIKVLRILNGTGNVLFLVDRLSH